LDGLPYEDSSVDMVRADDFLEHIPIGKTVQVVTEIWRVLKPGGIFESLTPSTDGRGAFQDPTHASFWNANSWLYYTDPATRHLYGMVPDFEVISIEDRVTSEDLQIIHTHALLKARKVDA
jgi:predicted SAM-dependent methyltransferase